MFARDNLINRNLWVKRQVSTIPKGEVILDAGAGELRNRQFCDGLKYISQDFCQYDGDGDGAGLQTGVWDTAQIDVVSDICSIPLASGSVDNIICTEVFEHIPNPVLALEELARLVKPGGRLILTAPFASLTHFAPYHYCTGFNKYWYDYHLQRLGFVISVTDSNGSWYSMVAQELLRTPWVARRYGRSYISAVLGYIALILMAPAFLALYVLNKLDRDSSELAAYGWMVVAEKI